MQTYTLILSEEQKNNLLEMLRYIASKVDSLSDEASALWETLRETEPNEPNEPNEGKP